MSLLFISLQQRLGPFQEKVFPNWLDKEIGAGETICNNHQTEKNILLQGKRTQ
jgi:hypothetical protein